MLMKDNLIRLFFLNHGSFHGINNTSFMANYSKDEDELYDILGYSCGLGELSPKEVYGLRERFVLNSYKPGYKRGLMLKYKASNVSELVDILMSKGILGLERKHISTLGEFRNCGIPSKFINQKISHALVLLEAKLNNSFYNGNALVEYRKDLLLTPSNEIKDKIKYYNFDLDILFRVEYYDKNTACIKDNVLYISEVEGYSEEELRDILFTCYLMGLPKLPLYLRKVFLSSVPGTISLFEIDSIHNLIDISNMCKCTVKELLQSFGFNLPDPEEMYSKYSGYFSWSNNKIYFSNETSDLFYTFELEEFAKAVSSKEIQRFDINLSLAIDLGNEDDCNQVPTSQFKKSNLFNK